MTTARQPHLVPGRASVGYPESDGKPIAESDVHMDEMFDLRYILRRYLGDVSDVYVGTSLLVYYEDGDPTCVFCPDVFVAFGVASGRRRTYKLWEEGQPPAVVIEVTSLSTWLEDQGNKKALCEHLGVGEYFLHDPEAEYLDPPLQGFRLIGRAYEPMMPDESGCLLSETLGLTLEHEDGHIVVRVAESGERLLPWEEEMRWLEARTEQARAEIRLHEARTEQARAEIRSLEARTEIERLREELRRLKGG